MVCSGLISVHASIGFKRISFALFITNAVFVTFSEYQSEEKIMKNKKIIADKAILNTATKIAGKKILSSEILVDDKTYLEIIAERIKVFPTLNKYTHSTIGQALEQRIFHPAEMDMTYFKPEITNDTNNKVRCYRFGEPIDLLYKFSTVLESFPEILHINFGK